MKTPALGCRSFMVLAAFSAMGSACLAFPQPNLAQVTNNNSAAPLQDLQTKDNPDPFSGSNGGQGMFDLLHQLQLGNGRDLNEFTLEQRDNLNDAAAEFRAKQRQLLQQQQQPQTSPTEDAASPQ